MKATRPYNTLPNALAWGDRANCLGDDEFFDEQATGAALAACRTCPVRQQCLDLAMRAEGTASAAYRFGIYGGLTTEERADLAKRTAAAQPEPEEPKSQPRWAGHEQSPCGTPAAYRRHFRRGENPCAACKDADRLHRAERVARSRVAA